MEIGDKELISILRRKAEGYNTNEVSSEFSYAEGQETLIKRKVTEKHVPPDLSAIKLLLELNLENTIELTEEEMEKEKQRLLALLKKSETEQNIE